MSGDTEPRIEAAAPARPEDEYARFDRFARAAYLAWAAAGHVGRPARAWETLHDSQRERWRMIARTVFIEASR